MLARHPSAFKTVKHTEGESASKGFLCCAATEKESGGLILLHRLCLLVLPEQGVERQVLQSQCRRLEAQNYNLSLTAEQLSHSMGVRGATH